MGAGACAKRCQNAQCAIHAGRCGTAAGHQRNAPRARGGQPFGAFQPKALGAAQHYIAPCLIRRPWCRGFCILRRRPDHQLADMGRCLKLTEGDFRFGGWEGAIGQG